MSVSAHAVERVTGRGADTRDRILDAGIVCVRRWGLRRVSVNDVAREAGLSRRTVYLHFADREELVLAVLTRNATQQLAKAAVRVRRRRSLTAQVAELAVLVLAMPADEMSLQLGYWPGESQDATLRLSRIDEVTDAWIDFWAELVEAARARGEVRADVDTRSAAEWIMRMIVSVALVPARTFDADDPEQVRRFVTDYAVRGLGPA